MLPPFFTDSSHCLPHEVRLRICFRYRFKAIPLPDNGCMRRCSLLRNNRFGAELRDVFGLSFPAPLISRLLSVGSVSVLLFPISVFFVITTEDFSVVCFIGSDCSTVSFRLSSPCSEISGITPPTFHPPAYQRRSCVRNPLSGTAPDVGCRRRHNLRPRPVRTAHRSRRLFHKASWDNHRAR